MTAKPKSPIVLRERRAMPSTDEHAVFCVCADPAVLESAAQAVTLVPGFFFVGGFSDYITAEKRPQFPPAVKSASACVALIDFDADPEGAIGTAERLQQTFSSRVRLVAVGTGMDAALLVRAMRAGCVEYLSKPLRVEELGASLRRFLAYHQASALETQSLGKVFAFFGAKGGVGTTTLAVHLALHLTVTHGCKTLLIDHKHQLGHVALYLGLESTPYHFDELLRNADRLDAELLRGYLLRHSSGLDVLASPDYSNEQYECTHGELELVMDVLRREYDFILIDSSIVYERANFSTIEQADEVFLVSTADVASLRDLARLVEHITRNPTAEPKLHLVTNRSTANESINAEQIRQAVSTKVELSIPNNFIELLQSINQGEPISPTSTSPFNTAVAAWARRMMSSEEGVEPTVKPERAGAARRLLQKEGSPLRWLKQRYS